ncbi:glycosyltransferase [uncultured Brachyspira sp.]|uniref:glycosyltransferase n=1 Tax=uncultured Brachyspira sp. TaxID=221953 RepID=UPI002638FB77|nr:glycosyltransferase [uncultured Brachyspira sp.]
MNNIDEIINKILWWIPFRKKRDFLRNELKESINKIIENKDKIISDKNKAIEDKDKIISDKNKAIEDKDKIISDKNKAIEDKNRVIEDRKRVIEDKNRVIEDKNRAIEDKNRAIEDRKRVIEDKNRVIEDIKKVIEDKNRVIEDKNRAIEDRKRVIEDKNRVIENKNKVIEDKNKVIEDKNKVIEDKKIYYEQLNKKIEIINNQVSNTSKELPKLKKEISLLDLRNKARMQILSLSNKKIIEEKRKERLIVSLTSFPQRIYDIDVVLFSLLNQTIKPDKIILWLGQEEFPNLEDDIPSHVLSMTKFGIEIEFCKNIRQYKKLIYALEKYPDDVIVTADDDAYYEYNWLEKLYNAYLENPNYIHCHRAHKMQFDENNHILTYNKWIQCIESTNTTPSFINFPTGIGGVLYKSKLLYKDIFDENLFMELCPKADDIWFWAMAVLNGTKINVVKDNINRPVELGYEYYINLWQVNVKQNLNDVQLNNVVNYYGNLLTNKINNEILP